MSEKVTFDFNNAKVLAQLRPSNTAAQSLYVPTNRTKAVIYGIFVCNQTSGKLGFDVYIDSDGTTYDGTTAIYYGTTVDVNNTVHIEIDAGIALTYGGSLGCRSNSADNVTFTVYGIEYQTSNGG